MDVMRTAISMLGLYDPDIGKEATRGDQSSAGRRSITAKIGVIAAYFHRARQGKPLPPVRDDLTEAEHFLYLMCGEAADERSERHSRCGFRVARRSRHECFHLQRARDHLDPDRFYSAITAAIGTLKGPLHGGANEGVIQMLEEIGSGRSGRCLHRAAARARRRRSWALATAFTRRSTRARRTCDAWR